MLPQKQKFGKRVGWGTAVLIITFFTFVMILPGQESLSSAPALTPTLPAEVIPSITITPTCSAPGEVRVQLYGANWDPAEAINLTWDGALQQVIPAGHTGSFSATWVKSEVSDGQHLVTGETVSATASAMLTVPCPAPQYQFLPLIAQDGLPTAPGPSLLVTPNCSNGSEAIFTVSGNNWPNEESIGLFWNTTPQAVVPAGHGGSFTQEWLKSNLVMGTAENPTIYSVLAQTNTYTVTAVFNVPCPGQDPATPTPSVPSLVLSPACSSVSAVQVTVEGFNWPRSEEVILYWEDEPQAVIPAGHNGAFVRQLTRTGLEIGAPDSPLAYEVRALSAYHDVVALFHTPCTELTPTPSMPDLALLGTPVIVSTPPLGAYQPIDVALVLYNVGGPIHSTFFLDVFFDPAGPISTTIPITQSVGFAAVESMATGELRIVHISVPQGFANEPDLHLVYGVADSLAQIAELDETNNVSPPSVLTYVTPTATPIATPTPESDISGMVFRWEGAWQPQPRALVTLIEEETGTAENTALSNPEGHFQFTGLPSGLYTVHACVVVENESYWGIRNSVRVPDASADVYLLPGPCN